MAVLFVVEAFIDIQTRIQAVPADTAYDCASVTSILEDGLKYFDTVCALDPNVVTPSVLKGLVIAPLCLLLWQHNVNLNRHIAIPYEMHLDEGTESLNKDWKTESARKSNCNKEWKTLWTWI